MSLNQKELSGVVLLIRMALQVSEQLLHDRRDSLGPVPDLKRDDPTVQFRWISNEVSKISIQRQENRVHLLCLSDDLIVRGISRKLISEPNNLVPF